MGVMKPNSDTEPAGVWIACHCVRLGVGVTPRMAGLAACPPNVATKAVAKRSMSAGAT